MDFKQFKRKFDTRYIDENIIPTIWELVKYNTIEFLDVGDTLRKNLGKFIAMFNNFKVNKYYKQLNYNKPNEHIVKDNSFENIKVLYVLTYYYINNERMMIYHKENKNYIKMSSSLYNTDEYYILIALNKFIRITNDWKNIL